MNNESKTETSAERCDEKYEALFDDSNNEIMFECSQAIEEVFQVKSQVIPNLQNPEESQTVVSSHGVNTASIKNNCHEALNNRTSVSISNKKINNDLRSPLISKDDKLYVVNKSYGKYYQGKTLQNKTEFKHPRQSLRINEGKLFF